MLKKLPVFVRLVILFLHPNRMPYCEAAVLEGVRMFMGHTFGIPHRALRDTKFRGFNIPKVSKCAKHIRIQN